MHWTSADDLLNMLIYGPEKQGASFSVINERPALSDESIAVQLALLWNIKPFLYLFYF